jgi:hypothetical protein
VKDSDDSGESEATSVSRGQEFAQIAQSQKFNELLSTFPKITHRLSGGDSGVELPAEAPALIR